MGGSLHWRRESGGVLRVVLAALLLFCQIAAQADAAAMPIPGSTADAIEQLALQTLCHGAPADHQAPAPVPAHHDCLLCPACHFAVHAAVLTTGGPAVRPPARVFIGLAAPPPASTGPPPRHRVAAQPTGPPARSA